MDRRGCNDAGTGQGGRQSLKMPDIMFFKLKMSKYEQENKKMLVFYLKSKITGVSEVKMEVTVLFPY